MKFKTLSIFLIALFSATMGMAQHKTKHTDDLLFLLRQPEHITQALKTIDQLKSDVNSSQAIKTGKVVIIICGEAVKNFAGDADNETVKEAQRLGVTFMGCGLSLNKFNLKKEDLMPGIMFVPNGFIKAFELQKAGYLSVEL